MSVIPALAIMLAQSPAIIGTVPQPNAALDALQIADMCETELNAAADSPEAVALYAEVSHGTITKRQALRSEALYFVDRLIREHYEAQR